jgi:hypothetical protein
VTSNGKEIKNDLFVGDKFTITYTARINKTDEGKDELAKIGRIEGVDFTRSIGFKDGKPTGNEAVDREGRDSFSDVEGAKAVTEQVVDKIGQKNDETEVTLSQTFEITGRKDGTRGGSNAIEFQIVVTDPQAPLTENRNNPQHRENPDSLPPNPALWTTRERDPRKGVTSDPSKRIGYRNRTRNEED